MIKSWQVDLRLFLLPDGKLAPLPARAQRLVDYWTEIVSQATQYDDPTTVLCRRRPGRRRGGTLLNIFFDIDTNYVLWLCPHCHDEGRIAGWEETFWDNDILAPEQFS